MSVTVNVENLKAMTSAQLEDLKKRIADAEKAKKEEAKQEDLKTVRKLCRLHGFTASHLKGYLKTRKRADKKPDEVVAKTPAKRPKVAAKLPVPEVIEADRRKHVREK